jgi:hypothetical protein
MSKFVDGISSLFSGPDTSAADAAAAKAKQDQQIALSRSQQETQNAAATADDNLGKAGRAPKGRRLLLAATGEGGVSSTLGGD